MILRALQIPAPSQESPISAWTAIERTQTLKMQECWLITQPAHAALAGEIAAQLDPTIFPGIDDSTLRAISLHDAGWGPLDAADIQASRAGIIRSATGFQPRSFIVVPATETIRAWTDS